jgi:hypothetical protein
VLAAIAWAAVLPWSAIAFAAQALGAVLLIFLAGVRREISFLTPAARPSQIVTMLWLFALGVAALLLAPPFAVAVLGPGLWQHRAA